MQEYYFLFGLGILWMIFAVIQDLKTTEISNWLNFSLIGIGLSYRAFYSLSMNDLMFFISGLFGFAVFFVLAYGFYYARAFAGGDAKLLMGFGVILPYKDFYELFFAGGIFIFSLFFFGVIYSLIYSIFIVFKKKEKFKKEFKIKMQNNKLWFIVFFIFGAIIGTISHFVFGIFVVSIFVLYLYVKALDICMIELVGTGNLMEGDWLEKSVRVKGKLIRKSVHGLNKEEIEILRKNGKAVLIKRGIPFTPAFLLALLAMAPFFSVLSVSVLSSLF